MRKREFVKKAGILSASILAVPALGFGEKSNVLIRLVIGSDHAGFPLKGPLLRLLQSWNYSVKDVGSFTPDPVDFPDISILLADEIKNGRAERGIMVCGT